MRSGSSCNKKRLSAAHIIPVTAISFILMCMTACGAVPTGQSSVQRSGTGNETAVVTPDTTEETPEPVSTMTNAGNTAALPETSTDTVPEKAPQDDENETGNDCMKKLSMDINGTIVSVAWEDNESVAALKELAAKDPIMIQMSMYGGFEQVGSLGTNLPRNDEQTTTQACDIVLYSGNQIVVFYGSNSWAYTRLGHVELSAAEMADLLGNGDVTITLFME